VHIAFRPVYKCTIPSQPPSRSVPFARFAAGASPAVDLCGRPYTAYCPNQPCGPGRRSGSAQRIKDLKDLSDGKSRAADVDTTSAAELFWYIDSTWFSL